MVSLLLASVAALTVPSAPPAAADPVSALQAQIQVLQGQVDAGAARLHRLAVAYDDASQAAATMAGQVAADDSQLAATRRQVRAQEAVLRREAVLSYTGAVGGAALAAPASDPTASEVSTEYLAVTVGDVSDTVDQLRLQQRQLADAEGAVRAAEQVQARDAAQAAATRSAALAQADAEQAQLAGDQNRLSALQAQIAAQAAAQSEAQAAARAAAARAAAVRAAPVPQGLPVNGGLVRTVTAALSPPTPAPAPAPVAPPPTAPPPTTGSTAPSAAVWLALRQCESGDNYQENTGNGFYGAYQFSQATWTGLGYPGRPDLEPPAMQDQAAQQLQAESGWGNWPACAAALGLT